MSRVSGGDGRFTDLVERMVFRDSNLVDDHRARASRRGGIGLKGHPELLE